MPWKNKHQQKKKQPDKNKQYAPQQAVVRQNGVTAVQQLQSATRTGSHRNGNLIEQNQQQQSAVYYGKPHAATHGNGSRVQRADMNQDQIIDRKTGQPLTQRPHSNAMTRQEYARTHHTSSTPNNQRYDQQRRSGSPGRDTEAYMRQVEYQQYMQNHQRSKSPSKMREAQIRYQLEYQKQQQQRSVSPPRASSPQRTSSAHRVVSPQRVASPHGNRNYLRHSDYQQRAVSPAKIREEQLRQIEYQRQLRKQQERQEHERRTSSPSNRAHYTPTVNSSDQYDQVSSSDTRRTRNDMNPRRALSSREQKTMDGIMEGGTLTREQRRF
ncbi:uncharacterized protein [Amphiura filiformis]|uniref:uncharacterized protein n=1 Tax=Amphiura filiformis TaxID=82378 RepID=UPI003B21B808